MTSDAPARPLLGAAARASALVTRLRHARPLHPRGRSHAAVLTVTGAGVTGVGLFDRRDRHDAVVRLSKATPTPGGWPDVLGLAVKVSTVDGPVDLLLSTGLGRGIGARHVLFPAFGVAAFYSTLDGFRGPHGRLYVGAWPAGRPWTFTLAVAGRTQDWQPFGVLALGEPLDAAADARLTFDPNGNDLPDLRADGAFRRLRGAAYRAAQRERRSLVARG